MRKTHLIIDGILVGLLVCETIALLRMKKTCGTLQIDTKGEKELYRFDIGDFDALPKKKYVRLKVNNKADLSHD